MTAWRAIAGRAAAGVWRGALGWALLFALTVASSALTYVSSFPDAASRTRLAMSMQGDGGVSMLLGPISGVGTVGGYTTYKTFVFLTTVGAVWALLAATRLLRGEEDAERWQLLVLGPTGPAGATAATLVSLGGAVVVVGVGGGLGAWVAAIDPDVGFGTAACAGYAASLIVPMATFAAVGAVTSQLARSRRLASGVGLGAIGAAFVVRMIADSGPRAHWLLWATPFGWSERVRALQATSLPPILVGGVATSVLAWGAVWAAGHRDVGAGVWAPSEVVRPRLFGLRSVWGLNLRTQISSLIGWFVGIVAGAGALGVVAHLTASTPPESMADLLGRFGAHGSFEREYFGIAFLLLAAVLALLPAGILGDAAADELDGRTVHVLARSPRRPQVLLAPVAVAAGAIVGTAVAAGVVAYGVARSQSAAPPFGSMIAAAANMVPVAFVALALGTVLLATVPRFAAPVVYGVVVWSFVADLLGSLVEGLAPVRHLSLFDAMALVPAAPVDWFAALVMVVGSLVAIGCAAVAFTRRDVATG